MKEQNEFRAGVYLLETLTSGMYNDPLSVYREYIQNSVDSIDTCSDRRNKQVGILIHQSHNSIIIRDNAEGLNAKEADHILSGVGTSEKNHDACLRGFRGIGRLGGIAFSDKVIFLTKAKGENVFTTQEWDCIKLRRYIESRSSSDMTLEELFGKVTVFRKYKTHEISKSYFEVRLEGVSSFRNYITDLKRVRDYISKVAPVDYDPETFSFRNRVNRYLSSNVPNFGNYQIFLNGRKVHKPYGDVVKITKGGHDEIIDIELLAINIEGETAACGWYSKRRDLIGSIIKGDNSSGITVRVGNILIGDSHLLDRCFREARFNSYVVGELHVVHPQLTPNSRRDDFVDNRVKTQFYNAVEKQIGLPISKAIRQRSRSKSETTPACFGMQEKKMQGVYSSAPKNLNLHYENGLESSKLFGDIPDGVVLNHILKSCKDCECVNKVLSRLKSKAIQAVPQP